MSVFLHAYTIQILHFYIDICMVEEYIRGDGSSIDLVIKYDIPSDLLRS